jgi:2-polyprenyl-3-methyl-5-hydroxy-6-metoxy-1,4-benzoquinol methylase
MSLAWTAMLPIGGVAAALPQLLAAFRSGDGVDADAFGPDWRHGHGGANRALYTYQLTGRLRQHLPDVHERLSAGAGRIADVGCGAGWAAIALARAYRGAQVTAVDLDAESIAQARLNAAQAGVADRVSFHVADAATLAGGRDYDLVCVFDAAHELARPVEVLRACRQLLAPAGAVLLLESRISDTCRVPADDLERFQYATSVLHCLPAGMVGEGAVGTGTVLRPAVVRSYAREAGFGSVQAYDFGDGFHRFYRLDG